MCDFGLGIPGDLLERIFERFFRIDTRLTREVSGLGLGLTVCKYLVALHRGHTGPKAVQLEAAHSMSGYPSEDQQR